MTCRSAQTVLNIFHHRWSDNSYLRQYWLDLMDNNYDYLQYLVLFNVLQKPNNNRILKQWWKIYLQKIHKNHFVEFKSECWQFHRHYSYKARIRVQQFPLFLNSRIIPINAVCFVVDNKAIQRYEYRDTLQYGQELVKKG